MAPLSRCVVLLLWVSFIFMCQDYVAAASTNPEAQWDAVRQITQDCPSSSQLNVPPSGNVCGTNITSLSGVTIVCDPSLNVIKLDFSYALSCNFSSLNLALLKLPKLTSLRMFRCGAEGHLPHQWSKLTQLTEMSIVDSSIKGSLPQRWKTLKNLIKLTISGTDCCLSNMEGKLPASYSAMSNLQFMDFRYLGFESTLPSSWGNLKSLQTLLISVNPNLTGTIPESYSNLDSIKEMRFTATGLQGPLPPSLSNLKNLQSMDLSNCEGMCGDVPPGLEGKVSFTPKPCPAAP